MTLWPTSGAVERERNEALTQLEAVEQDVNILRSLLPPARASPKTGMVKSLQPAVDALTPDLEGLYNNGYRDRVLRRLAATADAEAGSGTATLDCTRPRGRRRHEVHSRSCFGTERCGRPCAEGGCLCPWQDRNCPCRKSAGRCAGGTRQGSARQGDKSLGKDGEARDPPVDFRVGGPAMLWCAAGHRTL